MKQDLHPDNYREVVFQDSNTGDTFLTRSTAASSETIKVDGKEYPLVKVHISSASHPFYTGQEKLVDVEGRVDRFKARREAADKHKQELVKKSKKAKKSRSSPKKIGDTDAKAKAKSQSKPVKPKVEKTSADQTQKKTNQLEIKAKDAVPSKAQPQDTKPAEEPKAMPSPEAEKPDK